jgi:hypothetical protein
MFISKEVKWIRSTGSLVTSVSGQNGTLRVRLWRQMKAMVLQRYAMVSICCRPGPNCARRWPTCAMSCWPQMEWPTCCRWWKTTQQPRLNGGSCSTGVSLPAMERGTGTLLAQLPESESEARRSLRQLRKELEAIAAIDFFAGESLEWPVGNAITRRSG